MKLHTIVTILILVACLVPSGGAWAQNAKDKNAKPAAAEAKKEAAAKPADAATGDEAKKDGENPENPMGFNFDGDLPFKKLKAQSISYSPEGELIMIGQVIVESDQINVNCANLHMDPKTKILTADGGPVKMSQGDQIQAECQHLVYNTEKKSYVLKGGNPFIAQKGKDGSTVVIRGNVITIVQSPSGKPSVSVTGGTPVIEKIGGSDKKKETKSGKPGKKVGASNTDLIPMPKLGSEAVE